MILKNRSPSNIRIWISVLTEMKKPIVAAGAGMAQEMEILIIGYLSLLYKRQLIDPIDKPPSLIKTVFKLCEMIISYMKVILYKIYRNSITKSRLINNIIKTL